MSFYGSNFKIHQTATIVLNHVNRCPFTLCMFLKINKNKNNIRIFSNYSLYIYF